MIFLIFPTSAKLSAGAGKVTDLAASVHSESGHQSEIKLFVLEQTLIYHLFLFWPATRRDNLSLSPSEFSNNVMIHFLLEVWLIDGVGMRWHHLGSIWRGRLTEFQIFLFHNLIFDFWALICLNVFLLIGMLSNIPAKSPGRPNEQVHPHDNVFNS